MIYILMIWTTVAMAGDRHHQAKAMDWRPIGEFASGQMCEEAAQQLGVKADKFRCVRAK